MLNPVLSIVRSRLRLPRDGNWSGGDQVGARMDIRGVVGVRSAPPDYPPNWVCRTSES